MTQDVVGRVRAEESARLGEQDIRSLLRNLPGMVYRARPDRSADLMLNTEPLTGYTPDEINALPGKWLDLVHADDRDAVLADTAELIDHPCQVVHTYRILTRCGKVRWVEDRKSSLFAADGSFLGVEGVVFDIDDRKRTQMALVASETRFRQMFESMSSGFALHEIILDADGRPCDYRFLEVNPAFESMLGIAAADLLGRTVLEVMPSTEAYWIERFGKVATSGESTQFQEFSGQMQRHYRVTAYCPERGRFAVIVDDITELKRRDEQVRQAAVAFEHTRDGIAITDTEACVIAVNPAFTEITGYREDEVTGRNLRILKSGRHDPTFYQAMWQDLLDKGFWQGEIWNRRKDGDLYPEWLTISVARDEHGTAERYIGVFTDISRLKSAEAQLEFATHHDALTSLPNRSLLTIRHEHALERASRHRHRTALLLLDLDFFKNINDTLGHIVGDRLLIAVAERFRNRLRQEDTLARLGGDEFAVLMEEIDDANDAAVLASDLLAALDAPFLLGDAPEIHIAASIGISVSPGDGADPTLLMRNADAAVYLAKAQGRRTFRFYTESLTSAALERVTMETRLRKAIELGHLVLHFQPFIEAASGTIIGSEALVRWNDPDEGLIPPLRFISIAEDSGLIAPLGAWVLRAACRQMKAWLDAGRPLQTIAVNLSPRQFALQDVPELIRVTLAETGLEARFLELEITEGTLMEHGEGAITMLNRIRESGVRLSIDDFGTGYSSLGYLKRFPIDKLKIDQSFVRDISTDTNDAEIAATIIAMARSLKISVLAEGVETADQRSFLEQHACDYYQGYFFSRPVPAERFPESCPEACR